MAGHINTVVDDDTSLPEAALAKARLETAATLQLTVTRTYYETEVVELPDSWWDMLLCQYPWLQRVFGRPHLWKDVRCTAVYHCYPTKEDASA